MKKLFGILILTLISCSTGLANKDNVQNEIYKKNKVKTITSTVIEYIDNLTIKSTHIDYISYIDKNGNLTKTISPQYVSVITDYGIKEENIGNDTTIYKYNSQNILIKKTIKYTGGYNEYTYDNFGNRIKYCYIRSKSDNCCFFIKYEYGSDNKIVSMIYSAGSCSNISNENADNIKKFYKYDYHDNVIYDGLNNFEYKYNGERIIEKKEMDLVDKSSKNISLYDDYGQVINYKTYVNDKLISENQNMYNEEGLCIESKLIWYGILKYVYKYEYKYYQ
jgi:hypothetical protein